MKQTAQKDQDAKKIKSIVNALLPWFSKNARDLPWRREPYCKDPYCVYVSEIMLQQTQVKTVIPYWERWMRELPTIEALARARPAKIHKLWEGLGYYTRVRNLQKAAQEILATQNPSPGLSATLSPSDGERDRVRGFPKTFDAVLALPGIGRYTAGAICSIAFNQPTPILDGNVIRVLTRIHRIKTDPREKQTNAQLWQFAKALVTHAHERWGERPREPHSHNSKPALRKSRPTNSCSHLNQSLMELGALICTPRSPNCATCPVQTLCVAKKENLQNQLPNLGKRKTATERRFLAFVVERSGKFLVRQRPADVVNAHLWEFPTVEVEASAGRARPSVRAAASHTPNGVQRPDVSYQPNDFRVTSAKPLCTIKHSITRYRITLEAWRAELARNTPGRRPVLHGKWRGLAQLHDLAFTSAHKKVLARLGAPIT